MRTYVVLLPIYLDLVHRDFDDADLRGQEYQGFELLGYFMASGTRQAAHAAAKLCEIEGEELVCVNVSAMRTQRV